VNPAQLAALCLTHHHSDHLMDVGDILLTRWVCGGAMPFPVIAPEGPTTSYLERLLSLWADDITVRKDHGRRTTEPEIDLIDFLPREEPTVVWERSGVTVTSILVHHEPVEPAVAYRVDSGGASVVISGDTRVCASLKKLAHGCDILVHEAVMTEEVLKAGMPHVAAYHADCRELGAMVSDLDVATLVLTHLEPSPRDALAAQGFADEVRRGGYQGQLIVAHDLVAVDTAPTIS